MPKVELSSGNKSRNSYDFPKLHLEVKQCALVVPFEKDPTFEYVHTLSTPEFDDDGKVVMETVTNFKKQETRPKTVFVGRHVCIGDYAVLAEKGVDPKGCPVCRASTEVGDVKPPLRRFAMHVLRYATQPGGFSLQSPFSVSVQAWVFPNKIFERLVDFAEEWGDLRTHDLKLGPCENKNFQKFDIAVAATAQWRADKEREKLAVATYRENQCADLSALIGRKISRELIEDDLEKVVEGWQRAYGRRSASAERAKPSGAEVAAAVDLDDLLGAPAEKAPGAGDEDPNPKDRAAAEDEPGAAQVPDLGLDDLLGAPAATDEPTEEASAKTGGPTLDLDDLLEGL